MERKLLENVTELAVLFGRLTEAGELDLEKEDSATERLYDNLEEWAEEFEDWYSEEEDGEYYEAIEAFGIDKFKKLVFPKTQAGSIRQTGAGGHPTENTRHGRGGISRMGPPCHVSHDGGTGRH